MFTIYNQARYDLVINYRAEPVPPLKEDDRKWVADLLKEKGLR
ncbi:DUF4058 family protein [Leptodesmis sichuanensis A121]|nr:DUF4058 family protein [Leptodesmis sichuanensis A121]